MWFQQLLYSVAVFGARPICPVVNRAADGLGRYARALLDLLHMDFGVAGVASPQCGKSGRWLFPGCVWKRRWSHRIMFVVW